MIRRPALRACHGAAVLLEAAGVELDAAPLPSTLRGTPAPAPVLAPPTRPDVVEHRSTPALTVAPQSAPERAPLPAIDASWTVADEPEGRIAVEVVRRGRRRRLALSWTNRRRTAIEASPHQIAKLVEGIHAAARELGVELPSAPAAPRSDDTERDVVFDRVAAGFEIVRGRWVKAASTSRRGRA